MACGKSRGHGGRGYLCKGKDLAGTCGIPLHGDRAAVAVECAPRGVYDAIDAPTRLIWPDRRSCPIRSTIRRTTHGRAVFGNLVERFGVIMGHNGEIKTLWRQDGQWFVGKPGR